MLWLDINLWEARFEDGSANPLDAENPFVIRMRPFKCSDNWSDYLEIIFERGEDFLLIKEHLLDVCFVAWPPLAQDYEFVENIGEGSQATVDLYMQKAVQRKCSLGSVGVGPPKRQSFAVKKCRILDEQNSKYEEMMIFNEVNFLRELKICENIV